MKRHAMSLVGLLVLTFALTASASSASAAVPTADLGISHFHSPHAVDVGQLIRFRIGAVNYGPAASELDVYPSVSSNLEIIEVDCAFGVSADGTVCEYSNVPAGKSTTTFVVARVLNAPGTGFWLKVTLMNEGDQVDPNLGNNTAQVGGRIR
jgi:hypothetical protein